MKTVKFETSKGEKTGEVIKENKLTVWVKNGTDIFKRHIKKHCVEVVA